MNNGLVSIIVPIYNVAEYLDHCITTIVAQTYRNIEIILVDDGSQDNSGIKCDTWEKKDPRIKVYHKENGGLSDARNYGLKFARGEFICFVDGDDYIKPDLLKKAIPCMDDQTDMVVFGYILTYPDNMEINVSFEQKQYVFSNQGEVIGFLLGAFFEFKTGWSAWNRIYKREIIENNDLHFIDTKRIFAEDQLFCMSYLCHVKKLVCLDDCFYYYVQRDNSIMSVVLKNKKSVFSRCIEECKAFFDHAGGMVNGSDYLFYQPVFLYLLLEKWVKSCLRGTGFDLPEVRQTIIHEVSDKSDITYFTKSLDLLIEKKSEILSPFGLLKRMEMVECSKWLIGQKNHFKLICALMKIRDRLTGNKT